MRQLEKYILVILILLFCTGCTKKDATHQLTAKDLIEPVTSQEDFRVFYTDIENADIQDARVSPCVTYLSFDKSVTFGEYCRSIGESVKKGDIIAKSYTIDTQNTIVDLQEQLQNLKDKYQYEQANEQSQIDILGYQLKAMSGSARKEDLISKKAQLERIKLTKLQSTELEALDEKNLTDQINNLESKYGSCNIVAPFDGVIVGLLPESIGNRVSSTEKAVAIADNTQAVIQTNYVPQRSISGYDKIYALINGAKYDIEYCPYDNSEYKSMIAAGETPVGNFKFKDPIGDKQIGSYAVVVMVKSEHKHVLCVPNKAISADAEGKFVYKSQGGNKVRCNVVTGLSNGIYTEVTDGLLEGDIIFNDDSSNDGDVSDTAITKGDFSKEFKAEAKKVWLKEKALTFDPEDSKLVFDSYEVKAGKSVKKGQVIAYVTSENDEIALAEKNFELDALKKKSEAIKSEFTASLKAKKSEAGRLTSNLDIKINKAEIKQLKVNYNYQVSELTKQINSLQKAIDKMSVTENMTSITATEDCYITELGKLSKGDLISASTIIAKTARENDYYLAVDDKDGSLIYNSKVKITDDDQQIDGIVVSTWNASLPTALQNQSAIIRITNNADLTHNKVTINAESNVMKQVILINRDYLYTYNNQNYVKELNSDGRSIRRVFLAGGYNDQYCWCISELDLGLKLIKNTDK